MFSVLQTVDIYSQTNYSIVYQGTNKNVDLSDHGNAAPGTPVTLWSQWDGKNQVWKLLPTN